jgi:sugar lactone lactonase YvrE
MKREPFPIRLRNSAARHAGLLSALLLVIAACSAPSYAAQSVLDPDASYPEGPLFVGDALYYGEMGADRVSVYEHGVKRTFFHEDGCGPTALTPYRDGFAILCHLGGEIVAVDKTGAVTARFGKGLLRDPNDGYADGKGALYFSDPGIFSKDSRPEGLVYHLAADGTLAVAARDLWYPNGVYIDGDGVFVSETFRRRVWRYHVGADGALTDKTLFIDVDKIAPKPRHYYREAGPDGLERGPDGEMIVAIYGEGRLLRVDRTGKYLGQIDTPFYYVDNIAFGAPGAVIVGAFDNINPPLHGEVRWWKP